MNRLFLAIWILGALALIAWAQEPDVDMGDLDQCNYPTLVDNPGHYLSDVAWLGPCVDGEFAPHLPPDTDACDDGVRFLNISNGWTPCTRVQVEVTVTAGSLYPLYLAQGTELYLNAWKDGDLSGDFCGELPCAGGTASEWIIQDSVVTPGVWTFTFIDPGVFTQGRYDGVFRFRLTGKPVGRYGFGNVNTELCPNMTCGNFGYEHLGEVEDYVIHDLQLFVELGRFDAISGPNSVTLRWTTVSESENDGFEIERNGTVIHVETAQGASPTGHSYEWVDRSVDVGTVYSYTLRSVDLGGERRELATAEATPTAESPVVSEYALYQNYPNPFNPTTNIAFDLAENGAVMLRVYNVTGQIVATLVNETMESGHHTVRFDATGLPSGVYLYRLESGHFSATEKMLLTK